MPNLTGTNFKGANLSGLYGPSSASKVGMLSDETTICPTGRHGPWR